MTKSGKPKRAAMQAVASHFGGRWERPGQSGDGDLLIAGERIVVKVAPLMDRAPGRSVLSPPRLRFDRVARGLVARLRTSLGGLVPQGMTIVFTITAPIRLAARTARAMEERVANRLARQNLAKTSEDIICGNCVHIRFVKSGARSAPKVMGFVHNPDPDSDVLLDIAQSLLMNVVAKASGRTAPGFAKRWLVIVSGDGSPLLETYRQVYAELSPMKEFGKIFIVFGDGKVETLTG